MQDYLKEKASEEMVLFVSQEELKLLSEVLLSIIEKINRVLKDNVWNVKIMDVLQEYLIQIVELNKKLCSQMRE